jgi:hypothetical protein
MLKAYYKRLRQRGKLATVAIACRRKLLTILNAMAANNTDWAARQRRRRAGLTRRAWSAHPATKAPSRQRWCPSGGEGTGVGDFLPAFNWIV